MTEERRITDTELDALLAEARDAPPPALSEGLQARLIADALSVQLGAQAVKPAGRMSRLRSWLAELGGLPGAAGLATAGLVGVWIGFADPLAGSALGSELTFLLGDAMAGLSPSLAERIDPLLTTPFDDFTLID